jgi:prepilin-type N-terminal cleavage/methylation domain-containing protein
VKASMPKHSDERRLGAGFTMVELTMVLLIAGITAAIALPVVQTTVDKYQLKGAVSSATWAIQSTRFQALMLGYPYQVTFSGGTGGVNPSYQIANKATGASSYTNVGTSVPLSGRPVVLGATTVFQFQPSGTVATSPVSAAPYTFTITFKGTTETISVSNYGNIDVTP